MKSQQDAFLESETFRTYEEAYLRHDLKAMQDLYEGAEGWQQQLLDTFDHGAACSEAIGNPGRPQA